MKQIHKQITVRCQECKTEETFWVDSDKQKNDEWEDICDVCNTSMATHDIIEVLA